MSGSDIFKAVFVRVVLLLHNVVTIWRVTVVWSNLQFWLITLANVPFIIEGIYSIVRRKGLEYRWLCPCFLFYLLATLPGIWLLEINRQGTYVALNTTAIQDIEINGIRIPLRLDADTWVLVIEECLLYFMILGRWFLPRGEVSREQLSQLLFSFIAIASDIMELFSLFDEDQVRGSIVITYTLLSIWSWSIMQFALVLTIYSRPRRAKVVEKTYSILLEQKEALRLEIIAIFISLFMQDGPFLGLRLYCIIELNLVTYSVIFFTAKNFLVILLLIYRLIILVGTNCCGKKEIEEDMKELEKIVPPDESVVVSINEGFQDDKQALTENGIRQRVNRPNGDNGTPSAASSSSPTHADVVPGPNVEDNSARGAAKNMVTPKASASGSSGNGRPIPMASSASDTTDVEYVPDTTLVLQDPVPHSRLVSFRL